MRIADLLLHGQENAIPRRNLVNLTGLDDRTLRKQIEWERRQGTPILSDNHSGYYLPGTPEELERCVWSLRSRAREIAATADAIEGAVIE